jgi:hypothetical protein
MNAIITRNTMVNFAIQGTAIVPAGVQLDSCPLVVSVDPATNPDGLYIVSPLLTGTQMMPQVFTALLARLPEPPESSKGYTWSFCKLRRHDTLEKAAHEDISAVHDVINQLIQERSTDLIIPVGDDLP